MKTVELTNGRFCETLMLPIRWVVLGDNYYGRGYFFREQRIVHSAFTITMIKLSEVTQKSTTQSIMTFQIKALTVLSVAVVCCGTAKADLSFGTSGTISSYLAPAGAGALQYTSVAAASATVAQGQPSLASGAPGTVLSETFTPTSSFTLGGISLLGASGVGNVLGLHLYDVTGVDKQGSSAFYFPGTDLFGGGSGLSFTIPANGQLQYQFSLSNGSTSDQVSLLAGNTYALEVWTSAALGSSGFVWYRGAAVATNGQMMGSTDLTASISRNTIAALGLAGGAPRTASLALYSVVVPEPASAALLGMSGLLMLNHIRRRAKA